MKASKLIITLLILMTTSVANAQHAKDSTAQKKTDSELQKTESKKTKAGKKEKGIDTAATASDQPDAKKAKGKKEKDNTVKLDSASTRADSIKANLPKALKDAKSPKTTAAKKAPAPPKASKKSSAPIHEGVIIPGAEEKANASTKDKLDRTMKGPSGQRVYISPKGGRYYFDINGNQRFLRNDSPSEK